MFRAMITPIFRSTRLCVTACGTMHPYSYRLPATSWVHYTTSCNTQSSGPENGQNNCPKHVELIGIINKPLLLYLVGVYIIYINDARSSKYQIQKYFTPNFVDMKKYGGGGFGDVILACMYFSEKKKRLERQSNPIWKKSTISEVLVLVKTVFSINHGNACLVETSHWLNKKRSLIEKDRHLSLPICVVKEEKIPSGRSLKLREENCTNG